MIMFMSSVEKTKQKTFALYLYSVLIIWVVLVSFNLNMFNHKVHVFSEFGTYDSFALQFILICFISVSFILLSTKSFLSGSILKD